jgi:hypothetical protein
MKQYYYLIGKEQNGPFSIDELKEKLLSNETLIWTDGMENWQKIKNDLELQKALKLTSIPPPPPIENDQPITKTEFSGQIKVINEKQEAKEFNFLKPTKKQLSYYLIWVCSHVVIFLLTKTKTDFFQTYHDRPERFWPFTAEFFAEKINHPSLTYGCQTYDDKPCFYGIFTDYDITELLIYSVIPIIVFIIYSLTKKSQTKNS